MWTSRPWTGTSCRISSNIRSETKSTVSARCVILKPSLLILVYGKTASRKSVPGAWKVGACWSKGVSTCVGHDARGESSLGGVPQVLPANGQAPDGHCRDLWVILCPPDWPRVPRLSSFWVCVSGFLVSSAVKRVVSVTQVPPQCGWASPGQVPPPGRVGLIHPLGVWIEQKVEEGWICPSAPASALSWCHPISCPRVLRPPNVG